MKTIQPYLDEIFQELKVSLEIVHDQQYEFTVKKEDLPHICQRLKRGGGRLLTMIGTDERDLDKNFGLYYVFAFDEYGAVVTVHAMVEEEDPTYPSVTAILPSCDWYEREVHDLFGLKPIGHPDLRSLILHGDWPEGNYPLRKDYPIDQTQQPERAQEWFSTTYEGEGITKVPVGPIHAGIIEPGHFLFGVAGDVILHLDAQLFFKHRGLEKRAEALNVFEGVQLAERICGMCAFSHAISYCLAVERLAGVKVPKRAQILRMIYLELERLYNHIGDIGDICSGAGFHMGTSHGARLKEELQQLNDQLTGHRFLRGIASVGGVRRDLTKQDLIYLQATLRDLRRDFREIVNIILDHEIVLDRMATTGELTLEVADAREVVGPAGRASGRKIDVRKSHPYLLYDQVEFEVPYYEQGDVLARVHVRIDETFESFSMIDQLIEKIEEGDIQTEVSLEDIPAYRKGIGWTESSLGENVHWMMTGEDGRIERYRIRSAAYSNWPAVPTAVEGNIVPDFPIINKSFELCYACCDR